MLNSLRVLNQLSSLNEENSSKFISRDLLFSSLLLRCYLAIQDIRKGCALKRFVDVFRQCKQSLGNKRLQL
jgi:hypothetical protein